VSGNGQVTSVKVNEGFEGVQVTTINTKVTVDGGAGKVKTPNGSIASGKTDVTTGTFSGGSSDDSSGGSSGGTAARVQVKDSHGNTIGTFDSGTVLTIDLDNGTAARSVTVTKGMQPITVPSRTGYTFNGWSISGNTITAKWAAAQPALSTISISLDHSGDVELMIQRQAVISITAAAGNGAAVVLDVASSAPSIASVVLNGSSVTITGQQAGIVTITVTASADGCETATREFRVEVKASPGSEDPVENPNIAVTATEDVIKVDGTLEELAGKRCSLLCMAPGYTGEAAGWFDGAKDAVYVTEFTADAQGKFTVEFKLPSNAPAGKYTLLIGGGETIVVHTFQK